MSLEISASESGEKYVNEFMFMLFSRLLLSKATYIAFKLQFLHFISSSFPWEILRDIYCIMNDNVNLPDIYQT